MRTKTNITITVNSKTLQAAKKWAERKEFSLSEYISDALKWQIRHDEEKAEKALREHPSAFQTDTIARAALEAAWKYLKERNPQALTSELLRLENKHAQGRE